MAEEFKFPVVNLGQPKRGPLLADPVTAKIVAELERYVEGELMSDTQKRETIAAFMSGLMFATDLLVAKKKEGVILPVFLRRKVLELARTMGLTAIRDEDKKLTDSQGNAT